MQNTGINGNAAAGCASSIASCLCRCSDNSASVTYHIGHCSGSSSSGGTASATHYLLHLAATGRGTVRVANWLVMNPVGLQESEREKERVGQEKGETEVSLDLRVCGNWPAMRSQQLR